VAIVTHSKTVIESWLSAIEEDSDGLTKWEEGFVDSLRDQFDRTGSISDRQEEILERIYAEKTP
jgi:hypothetical protein